jgi:hypothetical protein
VRKIAGEIRARASTLDFPEGHQSGLDPRCRNLGMATRYLDEIGQAIETGKGERPAFTVEQLGWHAFGAALQAIAGLLGHLERPKEGGTPSPGDR